MWDKRNLINTHTHASLTCLLGLCLETCYHIHIFIIVFFALQNAVPQKGNEVNLTLGGIDLNNSGRLACFPQPHIIIVLFNVYVHIVKIAGLRSFMTSCNLSNFVVLLSKQIRNFWLYNFLMFMMDELSHLRCFIFLFHNFSFRRCLNSLQRY